MLRITVDTDEVGVPRSAALLVPLQLVPATFIGSAPPALREVHNVLVTLLQRGHQLKYCVTMH